MQTNLFTKLKQLLTRILEQRQELLDLRKQRTHNPLRVLGPIGGWHAEMAVRESISAVRFRFLQFERRKKLVDEVPEQRVEREVSLTQQQERVPSIGNEFVFKLKLAKVP